MQRERKRRFGINAIISLIEAGLCACIYDDDGVDAETSLFLSLCISISLLRLYTFFSRSLSVIIFSLKMRVSSKELFSSLKNPAKGKGAMPCPWYIKYITRTTKTTISHLGERTQLKTKVRCLVLCILPKAKARRLSLVYHAWVKEPSWRQRRDALSFVSCQRQRRDAFPW